MGRDVFYVGETASGCIAKLVTQYLGYCAFIAGVEGMLIGAKAGIDLDILAKIIPVSAGSSGVLNRSTDVILDRSFASNGTLDIVAKDIHLACELARESRGARLHRRHCRRHVPAGAGAGHGTGRLPGGGPHPGAACQRGVAGKRCLNCDSFDCGISLIFPGRGGMLTTGRPLANLLPRGRGVKDRGGDDAERPYERQSVAGAWWTSPPAR